MNKKNIKKKLKKICKFLCMILAWSFICHWPILVCGQEKAGYYPKVGDTLPDHTFTDLMNYPRKSFTISDFKGQWLVLDYWSEGCASCLASFPKMDKLRRDFAGRMEILMIGAYDIRRNQMKELFERRSKNYKLDLSTALDSVSYKKYAVASVPAIFVINPKGIIVAKTTGIDSSALAQLLSGQIPKLVKSYSSGEKRDDQLGGYNYKMPLLAGGTNTNGGVDTSAMFRSVLTTWTTQMPEHRITGFNESDFDGLKKLRGSGFAEAIGINLSELLLLAYTGSTVIFQRDSLNGIFSPKVIYEIKNTGEEKYAYSVKMPRGLATPAFARQLLLSDLHRYLGIYSAIEQREIDVYKLVVTDIKKVEHLKAKKSGGPVNKFAESEDGIGFHFSNYNMNRFIAGMVFNNSIASQYKDYPLVPPVVDSTGIDFNIDFEFTGDYRDFKDVMANLKKYGLNLVKGKKMMKCIVVHGLI